MSELLGCFFTLVDPRSLDLEAALERQGCPLASRLSGWLPGGSGFDVPATEIRDERDAEIHRLRAALEHKQHEIDVLAEALDYARTLLGDAQAR
jgi:hypothetical protein